MTADEVAEALRIDPETVRRWAREGRLRTVPMPGRALRFRRADVEELLTTDKPAVVRADVEPAESGAA